MTLGQRPASAETAKRAKPLDDANGQRHQPNGQQNDAGARIKGMFTTDKARAKMGRAYPVTSKES